MNPINGYDLGAAENEDGENAETFGEGAENEGEGEDLALGLGVAADGLNGAEADQTDGEGGAENGETGGDVTSDGGEEGHVRVCLGCCLVEPENPRLVWHVGPRWL